MTYTTDTITKQSLEKFQSFDVDTQLALLWFGYLDLKDQLHPGTNKGTAEPIAKALYDQIQAKSQQEQLQAQRDIVSCARTPISEEYSALSSSGKLMLWLMLSQGMERNEVVTVPSDYQLPDSTNEFVDQVQQLEFEQRVNFMKSAAVAMGANPQG